MNLYILVEGAETEMQLYPKWLSYLAPTLTQVFSYKKVTQNNYFMLSGGGIPSIYNHAINAIKDINDFGEYDYLIICLDSDELTVERRKEKLLETLKNVNVELKTSCQLKIIVQNRCIETWFLGNRKVYKRNPEGEKFKAYSSFYNVEVNDPELMQKHPDFALTSHFHEAYLREMLKEYNTRYSKSRPNAILKESYLHELIKRVEDEPTHLASFKSFLELVNMIKLEISLT